jgi:hypothetical protein
MDVNALIYTGRQEVPLVSSDLLAPIYPDLERLIESPDRIKSQWEHWLPSAANDDEPDNGLIEKSPEYGGKDPKFFFHYRPCLMKQLALARVDMELYYPMLHNMHQLYERCKYATEEILLALHNELPQYNIFSRHYSIPEYVRHVLRILYYKPGYRMMAKPHPDKSALTLHVSDSRPGLHFADDHQLHTVKPDKALAFTGMKAHILTNGLLKLNEHYVTNEFLDQPRWCCVFFTHIAVDVDDQTVRAMVKDRVTALSAMEI